jgi:hypothetical protein
MSIIEISENKAYKIESVKIKGKKYVNIRQMYKTRKTPDEWQHGRAGMAIEVADLEQVLKKMKVVGARPDSKFKELNLEKGNE